MPIEHWMSFSTFAEQRYFVYPDRQTYSGVLINGNMASHAPSALATFLLEKAPNLSYIINPLTHAFQHEPEAIISSATREVKSSIKKLADSLGTGIPELVGKKPISPEDLKGREEEFVANCLKFQRTKLSDAMQKDEVLKYFDQSPSNLSPYALVSPYFYMTELTLDQWLELNLKYAKLSVDFKENENEKIFVPIVVEQGVILNERLIKKIVDEFSNIEVDGFLIWVDNLNEHKASGAELNGLIELARGLRQESNNKAVINLHGGFFSILSAGELGGYAMTGVAHGPEFGEYRSVVPVGGGIPVPKYYMRALHIRMKYRNAVSLINSMGWLSDAETYFKYVCGCQECKEVIANDIRNFTRFDVEAMKEGTKERCLKHYLNCKKSEYDFVSKESKEKIIDDISETKETFQEVLGLNSVSYLELWLNTLNNYDR